ncbi:hypothetical protein BJ322DRAFT_165740 [Thelephora terrestris]|uniref:F-box domain-containing protein n=1 Tax=Thelephora terrestris TaxID=56493 RepID=A0A9P6HA98_9AGAM|nr:hypothetical protein BJ322DRAFT_165740 [Thelephora terrestris]
MSVPLSYLTALPTEILETILLHLPGQDIIKTEAVNKRFRDLVRNSPALQHRSELFDIGLIDNPRYPCDFTERRRLCSRYTHKWTSAKDMVKTTHAFYPAKSSSWTTAKYSGNGLFVSYPWKDEGLTFLYVPPVTSQRPPKTWSIPQFSFRAASYAAYPPENVVAIAELRQNSIRVHILNLRDGSPCDKLPSGIITWEAPSWANTQTVESMSMTSSRIATYLHCWCEQLPDCEVWKIIVWDWKMGNMVTFLSHEQPCITHSIPGS